MLSERELAQLCKLVIVRSKARVEQAGASRAFLIRAGIVSQDGELTAHYRPALVRSIRKMSKRTRLLHRLKRKQGQRTSLLASSGSMR